jgi:hypothetical protein
MLCITAGTIDILFALALVIGIVAVGTSNILTEQDIAPMTMSFVEVFLKGMAVFFAVAGMLAVAGGIMSLQRKNWGIALVGAIAAAVSLWMAILGIPAVVLTSISKSEFS